MRIRFLNSPRRLLLADTIAERSHLRGNAACVHALGSRGQGSAPRRLPRDQVRAAPLAAPHRFRRGLSACLCPAPEPLSSTNRTDLVGGF